ncbi:MAG: hypothetical protein JSW47_21450, partial [Phycisphaerales bacterium]
ALDMAEMETENRGDKQEGFHYTKPATISPDDEPATNTTGDSNSKKHQVHGQHAPITKLTETIEQETVQQTQYNSHSEPAGRTVYVVPPDINKDTGKRRAITSNHAKPDSAWQKSVQQHTNVSQHVSAANKYDMEKSLDDQAQNTLRRLVSPGKHSHSVKTEKADNPIHKATIPGHQGSHNLQSGQHRPTTSELPSGLSGNLTKPEQGMMKLQPGTISVQNADLRPRGLLQTPTWLSERQSELRKGNGLFLKDSRAETEPVTNVTIGRIEVRAAPRDVEQSGRKKKPSGVMSLDEYLRQRTQGGNR